MIGLLLVFCLLVVFGAIAGWEYLYRGPAAGTRALVGGATAIFGLVGFFLFSWALAVLLSPLVGA